MKHFADKAERMAAFIEKNNKELSTTVIVTSDTVRLICYHKHSLFITRCKYDIVKDTFTEVNDPGVKSAVMYAASMCED